MKKQLNLIIAIAIAMMALTSCNNDNEDEVAPDTTVIVDTTPFGEIIDDTFIPSDDAPLYPITPGIEWCYSGDIEFCSRVTDRTTIINNQVFTISESEFNGQITEGFSRVDEEGRLHSIVEYPFQNENREVVSTTNLDLEWFLESDPIGTEREFMAMSNRYTTNRHVFTLEEKGLTVTVNNVTYQNVIKISQVVFTDVDFGFGGPSQSIEAVAQDVYVARGIGNIKVVTTSGIGVGSNDIFLLSFTAVQ